MIGDRSSESPLAHGLPADVYSLGHRRHTQIVNDDEIRIDGHPSDPLDVLRALVTAYWSLVVMMGLSMPKRLDSRREKRGNVRYPDETGIGSRFGIVIELGLRPSKERFAPKAL